MQILLSSIQVREEDERGTHLNSPYTSQVDAPHKLAPFSSATSKTSNGDLRLTFRHTLTFDPSTEHSIKTFTTSTDADNLLPLDRTLSSGNEGVGRTNLVGCILDFIDFDLTETL